MVPSIAKTWAPKGHSPKLSVAGNWDKISSISAVGVSPKRKRLALYIKFHFNKNIRSAQLVNFLRYLLRHVQKPIFILWDRSRVHKSKLVQRFLAQHSRIYTHYFPGYAPELNPDEFVWTQLKKAISNGVPNNLLQLRRLLNKPLRKLQHSQKLLWSCIFASRLPW
jgi:putative transposase